MLLECPTRHRPRLRRQLVGARHTRRPRPRRPLLCAAEAHAALPVDGLRGSFDPVWTAGAEGRFLSGAFTTSSRHPLVVAGRILLLIALVAPGLGPALTVLHGAAGPLRSPIVIGLGVLAVLALRQVARRRR
ncbi:MAG: hypothetical protein ACR2JY_13845 [Chloroflexota bacterium]